VEGSLDVYDSSVDNLSGDSVLTPVGPLSAIIQPTAAIAGAGGSIRSADGRLTLKVPAGALTEPATFSFESTTTAAPQGTGPGYRLTPSGLTFSKPALLMLSYEPTDLEGSSADGLTIAASTPGGWLALGGGSVDPARHTLTVPLNRTPLAPAARRSSGGSSPAADSSELAVARSWILVPSEGIQPVLTGGHLQYKVYAIGGSSSTIAEGILLSSPYAVEVDWYLNGKRGFVNTADGLLDTTATSATYIAPACPPDVNPVEIRAEITNHYFPAILYRVSGVAHARVIPRKWKLKADPVCVITCATPLNYLSDVLRSSRLPLVEFALDDSLQSIQHLNLVGAITHARGPCQNCYKGTATLVDRGGDSDFLLIVEARWSIDADKMHLTVDLDYGGPTDLWQRCTDGDKQSEVILFGDEDGFFATVVRDAEDGESWELLDAEEPGRSLTVHFKLESVCP
jgi:hypothetical protein